MGTFDTIRCYVAMPEPDDDSCAVDFNSLTYQTRSLDQLMENYRITGDGVLEIEKGGTILSSKHGSDGRFVEAEKTCTIEFYAMDEGYWIKYLAVFDRGKMTEIELIDYRLQQFGRWEKA